MLAGFVVPLAGPGSEGRLAALLTPIMFPVILALGVSGLLVGVLQSYDRFSLAAFVPVAWNGVIIILTVLVRHRFRHGVEAYAVAWLIATVVQLAIVVYAIWRIDFHFYFRIDCHDPLVREVSC